MIGAARSGLAFVIGVAAVVLVAVSLVAVWAKVELLDTDRYVAAVSPLSADAAVREEVVDQVTAAVLEAVAADDLPDSLASTLEDAVRDQARSVVRSEAFADLWAETNRDLHEQAVAVLTSDDPSTRARHGELTINLTPVVDVVRTQVLDDVPGLSDLPDTDDVLPRIPLRIKVADASDVDRGRGIARAVDQWAWWTAAVTGLALLLTVLLARRRARALAWLGGGVVVAGAVTLLVSRAGAPAVRARVPSRVADDDATTAFYDALTDSLRHASWWSIAVGAVVAVVALAAVLVQRHRHDRLAPSDGGARI